MNSKNFFGTDGIRGLYGQYPLTPQDMWSLGWAVGRWILDQDQGPSHPFVLIGHDTRASCSMIEEALTGGLMGAGVGVVSVGCVPTPAVAFLTRAHRASMGLMISASHNPAPYNGIKFFNTAGEKLSLGQEKAISRCILDAHGQNGSGIKPPLDPHFIDDYESFLRKNVPDIGRLRLVVDCAHGAYSAIAPRVLRSCGAMIVEVLGASPDGHNINAECGAVYPQRLAHAVQHHQADAGISFDGDGDRVIIVNAGGQVQDGDQILAALALAQQPHWKSMAPCSENPWATSPDFTAGSRSGSGAGSEGQPSPAMPTSGGQILNSTSQAAMPPFGVVGTVVSNLGLEHFLNTQSIPFVRTDVGDRWIGQKLKELGWTLGGEPCGHIVLADALPTGDGLLAGLHVLRQISRHRHLFPIFQNTPSVMRNIALRIPNFGQHPEFLDYYRTLQNTLDQEQRILLRPSGTEPVIRILVEGPCQAYAAHLASTIAQALDDQQSALEGRVYA